MDKANEVTEVSEQETPFHQLPQEEQQRIIDANQKRVREASTLHEWDIRVPTAFAWFGILFLIGIPALIGSVMIWNESFNGWIFIIVGAIMFPYLRYLVMADKDYHYRLTTEGIIATYQDSIPEMAYTVVRGLSWFAMAICVMAIAVLGPLALVGAGGMALFAIFFTGFKSEMSEEYTLFHKEWSYTLTISKKYRALRFESTPFKSAFSRTLFCKVEDMELIAELIKEQVLIESVINIKGHPGI
ncbi:hypothetical protein D3C84_587450 [compost metagenome]